MTEKVDSFKFQEFDTGLEEALSRITSLVHQTSDLVVLTIKGEGQHVGKSEFARRITRVLDKKSFPAITLMGISDQDRSSFDFEISLMETQRREKPRVLIIEQREELNDLLFRIFLNRRFGNLGLNPEMVNVYITCPEYTSQEEVPSILEELRKQGWAVAIMNGQAHDDGQLGRYSDVGGRYQPR